MLIDDKKHSIFLCGQSRIRREALLFIHKQICVWLKSFMILVSQGFTEGLLKVVYIA